MLTYRFGANGLGVAHLGAPATIGITTAEAREWVARWLTAANATVTFTGCIPDALDIRLPNGDAPARPRDTPIITSPTVIHSPKAGVAISLVVPAEYSALLGQALRFELLSRLRHAQGLIHSVVVFTSPIGEPWHQLDLILDPNPENVTALFSASVIALREVAAEGLSADAVKYARNALLVELAWEDDIVSSYLD